MPGSPWTVGGPGALNETDPVPVASRKRRSAGTGLRGDGPGGGLAPASSHLDGGSRSETSAARAVREFFCFLRDEETLSSLQRAPMQRDRDDRNAGADSAIGDFRREFGRILQLHPPLAPKTLACTDWVASHYM